MEKIEDNNMKTEITLTEKLEKLSNLYNKLSKHGLLTKSEYTLPLKDTIGKTYFDQTQFSV